jgi:glutathione S-transferase
MFYKRALMHYSSFLRNAPEPDLLACNHVMTELDRLYGILNTRLQERTYLVGDKFTIADIASFAAADIAPGAGMDRTEFPNVHRWWRMIRERPAVRKGCSVPFAHPMMGPEYLERLRNDVDFRAKEDEVLQTVKRAKGGVWEA